MSMSGWEVPLFRAKNLKAHRYEQILFCPSIIPYNYLLYTLVKLQWGLNSNLSPDPREIDMNRWDMEGQKPSDHSLSGPAKHRYDFHQEKLYHLPSPFDLSDLHNQLLKEEGIKLVFFMCVSFINSETYYAHRW